FQAEDGIRDRNVTGVQTCALPILGVAGTLAGGSGARWSCPCDHVAACLWSASVGPDHTPAQLGAVRRDRWCPVGGGCPLRGEPRSEERRVGEGGGSRAAAADGSEG